ncbi:MAG: PilZ domain-containing protein [Proteobacteria bacterium]|nr:PilZ domain-containing protein [Pseudomonadota bacterium]MBU1640780.1 PilZ domain-containing protein [Pseudomonadota bacterium]
MSKRVRVNNDNLAAIKCPHCQSMKLISVHKFKGLKHSLKVKCTCNNSFSVSLDFRERYRKSTNIDAKYVKFDKDIRIVKGQAEPNLKCKVADLSLSGLALTIIGSHNLQVGDVLMVEFDLDDKANTHIKRKAIIRVIGQGFVGCQFDEAGSPAYDKALGFYLMP